MRRVDDYKEVWIVDFEFQVHEGGLPVVHCMVAREAFTRRLIRLSSDELYQLSKPPFDIGKNSLFVAYYASAEFGCFLELGWQVPRNILDLYVEFRRLLAGHKTEQRFSLLHALCYFNLSQHLPAAKEEWRQIAIRGGPFTTDESKGLLDYCQEDVDATTLLLEAMKNHFRFPYCLIRGRYMWSVALMERQGIPIDQEMLELLRNSWDCIREQLIERVDQSGVYSEGSFSQKRFEAFLAEQQIPWPRLASGRLALDDNTFRQQARSHPTSIAKYHELRTALSKLKLSRLAVGEDGRNRTLLSPFRSTTSRNQPSNAKFIFGPSTWIRGLIKPAPGKFIAYIDWSQQELGIAAALSGDPNMKDAYRSGDPYLRFAQMANAVPGNATKESHPGPRAAYKVCMLAVQYGMGAQSLASQLGKPLYEANRLLRAHKDTFPQYWEWNQRIMDTGFAQGRLETVFDWSRAVLPDSKPASVGNFPVQGNGAEMLRVAIMLMHEKGLEVSAPIHDAVLIEGPIDREVEFVGQAQNCMRKASEIILKGFALGSDSKSVKTPNRYMDEERGMSFWNEIMSILKKPSYEIQTFT